MIDPLDPRSLKTAREEAKLTPRDLALLAKVHETTITRIEGGKVDPRLDGTWAPIVRVLQSFGQASV
jgi:predicted transcriptional regulator